MTVLNWNPLRKALAMCRHKNVAVPIWWRDDDAVAMTSHLARLNETSVRTGIPVHLAIVPANVDPLLPSLINTSQLLPVVHGWAHLDHSDSRTKKNVFLTKRAGAAHETLNAIKVMQTLFGADMRRMFVPPWNRINAEISMVLKNQGYRVLSTYGARTATSAAGLDLVNTHLDPIFWGGSRDLIDPDVLIAKTAAHLHSRTEGREDAFEPFGLLSHHLVHTEAIWSFIEAFLNEMRMGGATVWSMENDK